MLFAQKSAHFFENLCNTFFAEKCCVACHTPFIAQNAPFLAAYLCPSCLTHMPPLHTHRCGLCGQPLANTDNATPVSPVVDVKNAIQDLKQKPLYSHQHTTYCLACLHQPPPWDALRVYAEYAHILKHLLLKYKFSANFSFIPLFSHILEHLCMALPPVHMLIPMPRHGQRLGLQGFNHILELCRPLQKKLCLPLRPQNLYRTRFTPPQASLPAIQRKKNPANSFLAQHVHHKDVLLIDDISTTGATLHHATRALRQAGATKIYVVLLARVPNDA